MCCHNKLYEDDNGNVERCKGCGQYTISFRNVCLTFSEDGLRAFIQTIESYCKAFADCPGDNVRNIRIATPARDITMLYSTNELRQFRTLLQHVTNRLNKENLFAFNYN